MMNLETSSDMIGQGEIVSITEYVKIAFTPNLFSFLTTLTHKKQTATLF